MMGDLTVITVCMWGDMPRAFDLNGVTKKHCWNTSLGRLRLSCGHQISRVAPDLAHRALGILRVKGELLSCTEETRRPL